MADEADHRRTPLSRGAATLLSSHAGGPRSATGDTEKAGQTPRGRQWQRKSARRRRRTQPHQPDTTDRPKPSTEWRTNRPASPPCVIAWSAMHSSGGEPPRISKRSRGAEPPAARRRRVVPGHPRSTLPSRMERRSGLCVGRSVCRCCRGYAAFNPAADSAEESDTTAELGPIRAATTRSIPCAAARARAIRVAIRASLAETFSCHGACVLRSRPTMR